MPLNFQNNETSNLIAQDQLLNNLLNQTEQQLSEFAQSNEFSSVLATTFGTDDNAEKITEVQQALSSGSFFNGLEVEVLPSSKLEGALGAYASESDTVYLAQEMLASSPEQGLSVLLEEAGHAVDDFLNETDATGDEGEMFASLVQENELSSQALASLRQEDDSATLNIDNESVTVEQAEFTVTSTADTNVSGTLRATIALANSTPEADTITFDNSLANETITLSEGNLTIKNPLTIEGLGSEELTINTEGNSRIFNIEKEDNEENIQVTIQDLTISGGSTNDSGGGIFNTENLTLKNTTISGNTAEEGGGIANDNGTINLTNSTISSNSGTFFETGGSISNSDGIINLTNSTISNNSDGGINNSGTINLINSTVSGNSDKGIDNNGIINLTNSTISNNSDGGINNSGTINLTNSTISGNSGTGINNEFQSTLIIKNSIVANSNEADIDINQGGTINTYGKNIVEDSSISGIINIDPNLSPLQDNGGSTLTQVPLEGSVAIDAGDNSVLPSDTSDLDGDGDTEEQIPFDQRGEGFDRVVNGTVDLGAVEVQNTPGTTLSIDSLNAVKEEGNSGTTSFTFQVTRSGDTSGETTVGYAVEPPVLPAVVDGQLGASSDDFAGGEFPSGTVDFAAGEISQTLSIEVAGDTTPEIESEEFENRDIFNVTLTNPSGNAQIEQATASGEILNDDQEDQPNIGQTEPNTITTLLETSPEIVPVSTGFFVDYAGTQDSTRTFNIQTSAGAQNLDAGATVNLTGTSNEFDYLRDGSTFQIIDNEGNLTAELLASTDTTSSVSFDDGNTEVAVAEGQITFGGLSFEDGEEIDGTMTDLMLEGGETTNAV